jgi:hypothetical protein
MIGAVCKREYLQMSSGRVSTVAPSFKYVPTYTGTGGVGKQPREKGKVSRGGGHPKPWLKFESPALVSELPHVYLSR